MLNKKLSALVTGGAGFIGSHLVERLLGEGHRVRVLGRPSAKFDKNLSAVLHHDNIIIDQRNLLDIPSDDTIFNGVNVVFHLASFTDQIVSKDKPEMVVNSNIQTLTRVLEAARIHHFKIIFTSSAAVYGKARWPTREDQPVNPIDPYGVSKWFGELILQNWNKFYNIPYLSFRIFNGYGPRVSKAGVFGVFMNKIMEGKAITITGDGSAQRDFIYVDDIVDALILGAKSSKSGVTYNVGTGVLRTVKELATILGADIEYIAPRLEEPTVYCADISLIKQDLDWSPRIALEEGVKKTLQNI